MSNTEKLFCTQRAFGRRVFYTRNSYRISQNSLAASRDSRLHLGAVFESLCARVWTQTSQQCLGPGVPGQVHCLPRVLHLCLLWPSRHISGSTPMFTLSQNTLLLWVLFSSSTPPPHKHTVTQKNKPTLFLQTSSGLSRPTLCFGALCP